MKVGSVKYMGFFTKYQNLNLRTCLSHHQTSTRLQWRTGTRQLKLSWEAYRVFHHSHDTTVLRRHHHGAQADSSDPQSWHCTHSVPLSETNTKNLKT